MKFKPTEINIGSFKLNSVTSGTISTQKTVQQRIVMNYKFTHGWGEQSGDMAPASGEVNIILDGDLIDSHSVKKATS
ncbi:hypothetical protein [Cytobacillus oceanisediminis]|jgi:hypothetical protein|uniref:hypothetical protein n=1 Tax=Cytobacillus oceanisediminis TaxID=665099 RepID=UPI00119E49A2|nr:hypothetical protein [Cytobacillus oceanisediminis]